MSIAEASQLLKQQSNPRVPALEPGDRLTRDEFERRWEAMPGLKRAELIEGVVHMPPAVRWDNHAAPHIKLTTWVGTFEAATPGVEAGDNASIRLDFENVPQPDVTLTISPGRGGSSRKSSDDYVEGAPEFVAEVSGSTVSIDLNAKLQVYRHNGVQEYLAWRIYDGAIDWLTLENGQYVPLPTDADGLIRSRVFPGLWLDPAAMIRMDLASVLKSLQLGIASPEHEAFVALLASRAKAAEQSNRV